MPTWLTPSVRRSMYAVTAALLGLAAALGWLTTEDSGRILDTITQVTGVLALVLARWHVDLPDETQAPPTDHRA